jgi:hypothetical protein
VIIVAIVASCVLNPIEFSIWGKVGDGKTSTFRKWIANKLNISQITAYQLFGDSAKAGELVKIYSELGWSAIPNTEKYGNRPWTIWDGVRQ